MKGYTIRRAGAEDLAIVMHHRRRMFEDMGFKDSQSLDNMMNTSMPLFEAGLEKGTYQGWLIEDEEGSVVAGGGIILLRFHSHPTDPTPERAWVVNMFTKPGHRRRGLARLLMSTMVEWCRATGMQSLYVHASDDGRSLYESLGFVPTNELRLTL